jgi:large subunit ribosomal protein L23
MSILDRIKGKKEEEKKPKKAASKKAPKEENVLDMVQEPVSEKASEAKPVALKEDTGRAHHILQNYHLSEKSNMVSTTGRYVFRVAKSANKLEVKKAIEKVYDVHVTDVNIMNIKGKTRRSGVIAGRTSNWKKAYVTLKDGERIAGLSEGI